MILRTLKGAGVVALGTVLGQGLVLVATPYLARLYSPSEFGALAMLTTVTNIAMAGACLRYDLAIPGSEDNRRGVLFMLSALCALATGVVVATMLSAYRSFAPKEMAAGLSMPWMVGISISLAGLQQAAIGLALQRRSYTSVGTIRFAQGASFGSLAALPGVGLLWAHAISFVPGLVDAARGIRGTERQGQIASLKSAAIEHRQFPLSSLPGAMLDVVGYSICVWLLTAAYGTTEAGHYSQVQRLVGAPLMLVSMSLGQVMLRQTADIAHDPALLRQFLKRILVMLGLVAVVVLTTLQLAGEPLLHWILGDGWNVKTSFVVPIALAVFVRACVSPLSSALITLRRFDLALRWQLLYFASACTVLASGAFHLHFDQFVFLYAAHECILYAVYLYLIWKATR